MPTFQVPAYWFEPKTLRRWLWANRSNLAESSRELLGTILTSDHITDQYVQADIHTVVRQVILNTDYADIVDSLDNIDFKRFVLDTIRDHWTDPNLSWIEPQNFSQIKRTLKRYFEHSNLKPRFCIWNIGQEIERSAAQARTHLDFAGQIGGYRTRDAAIELRAGCQKVVEQMEHLLKLLLEFSVGLIKICGLEPENLPIGLWSEKEHGVWGEIEIGLNNHSADLLNMIKAGLLPDHLSHWSSEIADFARLCYGTLMPQFGKQRKKVVLFGEESYRKYRGRASDAPEGSEAHLEDQLTYAVELTSGQLMKLCTQLRKHRNALAHGTSSIQPNLLLPRNLYKIAQEIDDDAQELMNVLKNNATCLPEAVRIVSLTHGVNGIELDAVAIPDDRAYKLVYTDQTLIYKLAPKAPECLAYSKGDQDFWLFPAPSRHRSHLLNPILAPRSVGDEYKLDFFLELEDVSQSIKGPEQFEEEPLIE